jgi:ribosome-associated protein
MILKYRQRIFKEVACQLFLFFMFLLISYFCVMMTELEERGLTAEVHYSASRSSGPGGQHVNKVSTRMELRFHIAESVLLSEDEKLLITEKLASRINAAGELVLVSQTERSQLQNKEKVTEKFYTLLARALTPRKKRRPTRPTLASKEERLEIKRHQAEKKERRKKADH